MSVETKLAIWEAVLENKDTYQHLFDKHGTAEVRRIIAESRLGVTLDILHEKAQELDYDEPFDWEFVPKVLPIMFDHNDGTCLEVPNVIVLALSEVFGSRISFEIRTCSRIGGQILIGKIPLTPYPGHVEVQLYALHVIDSPLINIWETQITQHENHHRLEPLRNLIALFRSYARDDIQRFGLSEAEGLLKELEG